MGNEQATCSGLEALEKLKPAKVEESDGPPPSGSGALSRRYAKQDDAVTLPVAE
jgi:hypothetical protein